MMEYSTAFPDIAMIGFGEAAHVIAGSWRHNGRSGLRTYDRGLGNPERRYLIHARCEEAGVEPRDHAKSALAGAGLVIWLVTADEALAAAIACAPHLEPGSLWLDGNSCAPETKVKAASVIDAAGAHYVRRKASTYASPITAPLHLHRSAEITTVAGAI
ncbi:NAD(P)-binding domain-containing protein [Rhizobium sp. SL86]|uniref:NAD(P)-binding domain-containing protein n=1 Tax=Rhizobium sp. SL86 TaxID=2995148 RepID=UPI003FA370B9